jgi:hypothetical protein
MNRTLLIVLVNKRKESAPTVQKILTEWGCVIKTRVGIHDGILDDCSNTGLIILELAGEKEKQQELSRKIELLDGVKTELINISLEK